MDIVLPPEVLNAALRISLDPAPRATRTIDAPLRALFPHLKPEEIEEADLTCRTLKRMAFKRIEWVQRGKATESTARAYIVEEWPWIDAENLSHLWSQGMYFAARG